LVEGQPIDPEERREANPATEHNKTTNLPGGDGICGTILQKTDSWGKQFLPICLELLPKSSPSPEKQ
jgi:hypothetical protein